MPSLSADPLLLLLTAALLATLLGAGLALGWARHRLAKAQAELQQQQAEWSAWRAQIERRLADRREPDWTPLLQRLSAMEKALGHIRMPAPEPVNLRPVLDAIASIERPPSVNLEPLHNRLLGLEDAVRSAGGVPAALAPQLDLSGVHSRLDRVERQIARISSPAAAAAAGLPQN